MPMPTFLPLPPIPHDLPAFQRMGTDAWKAVLDAPAAQAMAWITEAAARGHASSQTLRGQWLLDGRGAARNAKAAFASFLQAAQQGDDMGMNMAGRCLENGWGTAPDLPAAIAWYRQAANLGLDAGLYNFANQLASGVGLPRDDKRALALYTRAAGMGHAKSMTKAGRFHEDGLGGVPRDAARAREFYRRGAEAGDFRGQYQYARVLAEAGDLEPALRWLQKVPLTATPGFLEEVGQLLAGSADSRFSALGREMRDRAALLRDPAAQR